MTIGFRAATNVVNGTAGTSVPVPAPPGIVNGDTLVAFVAETGTGAITPPAGWTLIGTQAASTNVTVAAYRKTASGEPGSWSWTLGASARNWGWVGAYTGVELTAPIASSASAPFTSGGTVFASPTLTQPSFARVLTAVGAVRAASGTGTTWTEGAPNELFDGTTNGGVGTDITGAVSDSPFGGFDQFTASQSQSQAVAWTLMLTPAFIGLDRSSLIVAKVEAAFGANPDGDPAAWTWTDISAYLFAEHVVITKGRADWSGKANPSEIRLALRNGDGRFTPDNPTSPYYPNIRRNLPIRVSLPFGYNPPTERGTAFARSWRLTWDGSKDNAIVRVVCKGRTSRMQRGANALRSAMRRTMLSSARLSPPVAPLAYWPCEDGSSAIAAASAVAGVGPATASGVSFGADSTLSGSLPLPTLVAGGSVAGYPPPYAATGQWCLMAAVKVAARPASAAAVLYATGTGTARIWTIAVTPGVPDTIGIRAYDTNGAQILANDVGLTSAAFYGVWQLLSLGVKQNGPNVDYQMQFFTPFAGTGIAGGLNAFTHGNVTEVSVVPYADLAGIAFGHMAVFASPTFDITFDPAFMAGALNGFASETPGNRFQRLCQEENIPAAVESGVALNVLAMGPQPAGSVLTALGETEDVDAGLIHDGGTLGGLVFNSRAFRYNAVPTLTMDNNLFQVPADFSAVFDDAEIINDVTASRSGGSSARSTSAANVAAEGTYEGPVTVNAQDDTQLPNIAAWRVNRGTAPGMRYPQASLDLRANPTLIRSWLASKVGSRVRVTNLPSTHGPSDADVFIEGYTETIDAFTWQVVANCSPARPFDVFVVEGTGNTGRLDSDASTLTGGVSATATSLSVATAATSPLWSTGSTPFDIDVAGERMTVTTVTGSSSPQTFTVSRSVNGVAKAQANNAAVKLWHPSVLAL